MILVQQTLPQQTIYCWKENLMASRIHINIGKHFDFVTLRAIFAKLFRNGSRMAVRKNASF